MEPFSPKTDERPAQTARRVIDIVRQGQPWPLDRRTATLWRLRQRMAEVTRPAPRRRPVAAWAGAVALATLALVLAARVVREGGLTGPGNSGGPVSIRTPTASSLPAAPEPPTTIDLPDLGLIEISMGEGFELRELLTERRIQLSAGTLRAHILRQDPGRPAVVVTPHLRIVVVGTRFDVHIDARRTLVEVLEGKVRVIAFNDAGLLLEAGASISSDDPRLLATLPSVASPPTPGTAPAPAPRLRRDRAPRLVARATSEPACDQQPSLEDQRACFERVAAGSGFAAQNALYTLGVLARDVEQRPEQAIASFREYGQRFPSGLLAPEAALGVLDLLERQGREAEAVEQATEFERRFATDPRRPEVTLLRAKLLCRHPARRTEALALLERLAVWPGPRLAEAVARARMRCAAEDAPANPAPREPAP